VEWPERLPTADGGLSEAGGGERLLGSKRTDGVDDGVDPLDPVQRLLDQLDGRDLAVADELPKLRRRGEGER
jgi:hypothetical protein